MITFENYIHGSVCLQLMSHTKTELKGIVSLHLLMVLALLIITALEWEYTIYKPSSAFG